jgi:hypothetical protein
MLGLGLNISKGAISFLPAWLGAFISRVTTDGGSTENSQCAKGDIKYLQTLERTAIILTLLEIDLDSEGGVLEAKDCLINSMEELHTIL